MPVCIAGMHRSGTSMVTKLLHESGLYLGAESDLLPAGPANPEGHRENRQFVRLNRRILLRLGGDWFAPPPIPARWTAGRLAPLRREAETLLAQFADREPWGWKDPRNALTLPFWRAILGPVRVVVVVRNPLEVAESLQKRNRVSRAHGLALWHVYNRRLMDAVAPPNRIVTHYGTYFREPDLERRRLLTFLELPVDGGVAATASASPVADLRHHQHTIRDLLDHEVAPATIDLYRELCAEAGWLDTEGEERRCASVRS